MSALLDKVIRPAGRRRGRRQFIRVTLGIPARHRAGPYDTPIDELLGYYPWDHRSFL